MSLDTVLSKVQQEVPECVAVGYVDMSTGMLLGVKTLDSHPQEVLDLVAAATADLFQGKSVTAIEKMFRKSRGQPEDSRHYFNEIIVFSENLLHVFLRSNAEFSEDAQDGFYDLLDALKARIRADRGMGPGGVEQGDGYRGRGTT